MDRSRSYHSSVFDESRALIFLYYSAAADTQPHLYCRILILFRVILIIFSVIVVVLPQPTATQSFKNIRLLFSLLFVFLCVSEIFCHWCQIIPLDFSAGFFVVGPFYQEKITLDANFTNSDLAPL